MQHDIAPMAPLPEVIDLTTCTTPEPELMHPAALKRDKSKFNIWSLPPAPGSADGLAEVKQNQASLPLQTAPVAKKKKKDKKKKQTPAATQVKKAKPKDRTLRVSEKNLGKVLRLIYNPASSLVDIEFYFKKFAGSNATIIGGSQAKDAVERLDTGATEKKAFDRLSQMAGVDIIEPILQWGFVGQHLRVVREERGHLNVTERFTVRVERTKKQDLPRDAPKPLSLEQTEFDCGPPLTLSFCSESPVTLPDAVPLMAPVPYPPSMSSHLPTSTSAPIHHISSMALARPPEQDKVAETADLQPSPVHDSSSSLCEDVAVLKDHLQVAEPLGKGVEESTTEKEIKLRLRIADDELQASCESFMELELVRLKMTRKGPPTQGSFDPLAYCRLLEDMRRNIERSQEAIRVAQDHAKRLYHVSERETQTGLEKDEDVARISAASIQHMKERERQLALEQADTFLASLERQMGSR